jgi:hypothetical protein
MISSLDNSGHYDHTPATRVSRPRAIPHLEIGTAHGVQSGGWPLRSNGRARSDGGNVEGRRSLFEYQLPLIGSVRRRYPQVYDQTYYTT